MDLVLHKNATRIKLIGVLNELNSHVGFALVVMANIDKLADL